MHSFIKKIIYSLPLPFRYITVLARELWWKTLMEKWERINYSHLPTITPKSGPIKNILIYHISGLSFAGTEKCLQLIADSLAKDYKVVFMYGDKLVANERKQAMHSNIIFVPFSYETSEVTAPHRITRMKPHLKEVLLTYDIDLMVTASPGYSHYPWNIISNIPIILVNIFGAPTLQKNIRKFIGISDTVRLHAQHWTGKLPSRDITMYAPLAKQPPENIRQLGVDLKAKFSIPKEDFVFGRIGRNDDSIFDPIGIRAWQKIASDYPNVHYLIMSPPPILVDIVKKEKIPRVHFILPSASEADVWAFHGAINAMAHFRRDGETSGVAIAESLMVGNPIITHRSHIWNAHLEYLDESCALIAGTDDVFEYSEHMKTFIGLHRHHLDRWTEMQISAREIGADNFSPLVYSDNIRHIVTNI